MLSVVGTYPLWSATEAFLYHDRMRHRSALGLADPIVANRFLLWAVAALCTTLSIWSVNLPYFLGVQPELGAMGSAS